MGEKQTPGPLDRLSGIFGDVHKLVSLAYLPPGSPRGEYLKEFVSKVPSLSKVGSDNGPESGFGSQTTERRFRISKTAFTR